MKKPLLKYTYCWFIGFQSIMRFWTRLPFVLIKRSTTAPKHTQTKQQQNCKCMVFWIFSLYYPKLNKKRQLDEKKFFLRNRKAAAAVICKNRKSQVIQSSRAASLEEQNSNFGVFEQFLAKNCSKTAKNRKWPILVLPHVDFTKIAKSSLFYYQFWLF